MNNNKVGKILIVDDEVELKNILVEALISQGYDAVGFTAGDVALATLREQTYDILLTDLMMPGMDGLTLVRESMRIDPNLICIMMTGQGTIQTAVDAMKSGTFDYVLKPFRLQTMLPVLTRGMNTRHLRLENIQLREAVAIHELGQTIAFTLDPQTVLSKLADAALLQSDADEVSVLLPAETGEEFYVAAVRGEKHERLLGERIPFGDSVSSWVAHQKQPVILNGEIDDERFLALWPRPEISSSISIPMLVAQKLIGVLNVNVVNKARPFTLGQMKALTILAGIAAAALDSASLYAQLLKVEANYRSIFENAVEGIFQSTPAGRFITVNPAFARILGYHSPEDVVETITDIGQQVYVNAKDRVRSREQHDLIQGFEFEAFQKSGEKIWLSVNRRALKDENGQTRYYEGSIEDVTERRRVEEALRETARSKAESLALLDTLISSAPIGFAFHNRDLVFERINESLAAINGLPVEEHLGRKLSEVLPEMSRSLEPLLNQVIQTGKPVINLELSGETRADPNQMHYWVTSFYPVRMQGGEILGVGVLVSDVTERKRAEEALRKSEERYRDLVENAQDIIYSHDLQGNYISSNKAGEEITGYSLEESLKLNLAETVAPEYIQKAREMLTRKLAGEDVTAYELELIAKDGHRVSVEVNTRLVLEEGVAVAVTGIARDITDRKRAEAELRRLAAVVQETADSVVVTDKEGNIQYVNPAFERITGYTKEEALNQNPRFLKSGKTDPAVYKKLWETIARGEVWSGHLINRRKDGKLFEERVTISAIYDESHEIVNYVAVKQDISDFVLLEEQLRQSQKMEAIGQLAGGVAHDFNNLLTAINGYSTLALQRLDDSHPVKSYLVEVKKAGERAANLTRQLLAFGRKQILQPMLINLNDVVTDMSKMLQRLIGEDIQLNAKLAPDLMRVKADPGQIEQVLVNLVVNARDAMPQGGDLTVETASVELDHDYASKRIGVSAGKYVMLAVSDTGTGMDEQTRARIFDPFFTTKEKGKGTGLGLSTVYGIIKQSGGNIWVYSEPNRGTTFKVYLPQIVAAVPQTEKPELEISIPTGSETILVVEDEDVVRGLTRQILEEAGYRVLDTARGEEAVQICAEGKESIALLLTDVVMPQTSGKEVADQASKLVPGLKVLFMSGYTDEAIVHHGVLDSNIEFIQKPFTPIALTMKIRDVLDANGNGGRTREKK